MTPYGKKTSQWNIVNWFMTTVQLSPDYNFIVPTTAPTHTRLGKTKATILQDSGMDRLLTKSWKAMTLQDSSIDRLHF